MATEQVLPPEEIETTAELAAALQHLVGRTIRPLSNRLLDLIAWDREKADREKRPGMKPARKPAASTGVIATWLNGTNPPNQEELHFLLRSRGNHPAGHTVDETLLDRWTEASTRVRRNETTGPPGDTRRVSTITDHYALDKLGIARAIQLPNIDPNTLPTHINRDIDPDLADRVTKAAAAGSFIVLRGPSGGGKSHAALHTITTLLGDKDNALGDWWFVKPSSADDIHALATHPVPRTVLWLDELAHH